MDSGSLFYSFFLIFTGAALLATVALATRQPLIVAYIVLGGIFGPSGLAMITDTGLLTDIAHAGILFLLFLLGLDMQPSHLLHMLRKTAIVGLLSSVIFAVMGYGCAKAFGFNDTESLVIGGAVMFSSTIIGIKLLPTTVLHHKHTGELLVSLLLLQDLLAILMLLVLYNSKDLANGYLPLLGTLAMLPILVLSAWLSVRYILLPLMARYDRFHEYMFLLAIGWCLGLSELAHSLGLSAEIGAFVAGVTIATSPISQFIAINLKPLRDFFLILFFFSVGASFNLNLLSAVIVPGAVLALLCLIVKPPVFWFFLRGVSEKKKTAWEVGVRLGQNSEFALLIATVATAQGLIDVEASHVIQAAAILTLLLSSYIVVFNYESPIAVSDRLRRD
ncbi:cation:proton antiporter [Parendozoicomonas haliclonae]|uniref:Glutathione-regulated potassium-efflux system protein KefC n=1 Tax=Parendozoicomonas haliclonae TaxID=1960125 RepID=A0A1X7AMB7_9GAMM|nr:cation:proton antiporter [Parendozoicomonas haliclonae]SMA49124.1 Glutathione-regulated potassium-efflux system protein KefC [Parendozoicomonas haliclonae]